MPEQRYSANDHRKDFMIDHKESDLRCLGIEPGLPDSHLLNYPYEFKEV
jgi:hypothetical protein